MQQQNNLPIGVFDSGVGGLTVVRALMERLPFENILYFGDTARVPYGTKSIITIEHFAAQITRFLLDKKVKMLIIACNTVAAVAAEQVRALAGRAIPVLDVIEAGAKAAVANHNAGALGVIGTLATINSNAYACSIHRFNDTLRVFSQACPLFVPLIEEGWLEHDVTRMTAREYLKPLRAENIDRLVLGCTHYPLLKPLLQDELGTQVKLIDSATTVADEAAHILKQHKLQRNPQNALDGGTVDFIVSDVPLRFRQIGEQFLGRTLDQITHIEWP